MLNTDQLLIDFYESKSALDILTKEVDEKKKKVLEFLLQCPDKKSSVGKVGFYLRTTPSYQFTKKVLEAEALIKDMNEDMKASKQEEIKTGVAKVISESYAVVVQQPK